MKSETVKEYKKRVASTGGNAVVAKYGKEYMSKLGKKAAQSRKASLPTDDVATAKQV